MNEHLFPVEKSLFEDHGGLTPEFHLSILLPGHCLLLQTLFSSPTVSAYLTHGANRDISP